MSSIPALFVLMMLAVCLGVGIVLRQAANLVETYDHGWGSPRLAQRLSILGVILLSLAGTGWLAIALNLVLASDPGLWIGLLVPGIVHLGLSGVFLFRWAHAVRTEHDPYADTREGLVVRLFLAFLCMGPLALHVVPFSTAQQGVRIARGLSWWWAFIAMIFCAVAVPNTLGAVMILSALAALGIAASSIVTIRNALQRTYQRYWNLWQISLLLRTRKPLAEGIDFLSDFCRGRHRRQLIDIADELQDGADPADVFIQPTMLSRLEGAQVSLGMRSGRLDQVLGDLQRRRTTYLQEGLQTQNPVLAVIYMWAVALVLMSTTSFLMYYIVPKFKKIFDDFGTELPALTNSMIGMSDSFVNYWYLCIPFVFAALCGLSLAGLLPVLSGHAGARERLSRLWPRICLPDILRTLAQAVLAKVPLEEALSPLIRRQLRIPLHVRLVRLQEALREGENCWLAMAEQGLLTPVESKLLLSAERAGNLPWALETLSRKFEQRWRFWVLFCFEFIQPVLVVIVSLAVAFFAIAFFLPLVKLINDLS